MTIPEQTFVFADLAGYTALTEAHGDDVAADVAIEFCRELNRLLPAGAQDVKSLGDACMVRVPDPLDAVAFGVALVQDAAADRPFPHVRVGMHTGPAVRRGSDWFGAAVNVAARVAERAGPGAVLLTDATRNAIGDIDGLDLRPLGSEALRNVKRLTATWQVRLAANDVEQVDPVCRMRIRGHAITRRRDAGETLSFCSAGCADAFDRAPTAYLNPDQSVA